MEKGKILEAKAKAELGELVSVEEVKIAGYNNARVVRDNLLNIPDRIEFQLASLDNEKKIHEILLNEIRAMLKAANVSFDITVVGNFDRVIEAISATEA
ncbi:MAG: hypothetical protein LBE97_01920 [Holosporales bacterium]|jgi:phage terminase Nu1 subunit (DNA packaging protein)|nr:hypothetical protein [Holosporales bacterium]